MLISKQKGGCQFLCSPKRLRFLGKINMKEFRFKVGQKVAVCTRKCGLTYPDNITTITEQTLASYFEGGCNWYRIEDCDEIVREDWLEEVPNNG